MVEQRASRGRLVGRYVVHDRIAAGGMATVHVGRLLGAAGFSRTVAIKRLHDQYAKDPDFVAMLLDEARLAALIRHPNVVPTLDVVAEEDELLVVMEYVEGDSAAHLVKLTLGNGDRVPVPYAAAIVAQALHGLHAAHVTRDKNGDPLGIVHRDVSPQNILVGIDGIARVLDFGIAKAASRATSTEDGQIKGKTAYMAPEQLQHGAVDRRTDVFAAGVVLWEICTGKRLFFADSPSEVMSRVLTAPITPPHELAPEVPPALSTICMKSLERDASKRWDTAEEMALAIEDALPMPRGKEVGAWVAKTAKLVLDGRAALVKQVETSSHKMPVAAATSDPELAKAIEEAERRRQNADMDTAVGGKAPASGPVSAPSSERRSARALSPPSGIEEGTSLSAVEPTPNPFEKKRGSRAGLVLALVGFAALALSIVIAIAVTRPRLPTVDAAGPKPASTADPHATASAAGEIATPNVAADAGAPVASASAKVDTKPAVKPSAGQSPGKPVVAKPAGPTPKKPSCDPPFDVDANGNKHFKPECL